MSDVDEPSNPSVSEVKETPTVNVEQHESVETPADQDVPSTSKRVRVPTKKGKQYEIDSCLKKFSKHVRKLKRMLKDLYVEITAGNDAEAIRSAIKVTNAALNDADDILCDLEESKLYELTSRAKETLQDMIERRSTISSLCLSNLHQSVKSKSPSVSHAGSIKSSSVESNSLHYENVLKLQKAATLKKELSYHNAQSKLKEKRAALEMEEERLRKECELAALEASLEVSKAAEENFHDELSKIPHETAKGKNDRILRSIANSVVSNAAEPKLPVLKSTIISKRHLC